jgi:hypothetical protein
MKRHSCRAKTKLATLKRQLRIVIQETDKLKFVNPVLYGAEVLAKQILRSL